MDTQDPPEQHYLENDYLIFRKALDAHARRFGVTFTGEEATALYEHWERRSQQWQGESEATQ